MADEKGVLSLKKASSEPQQITLRRQTTSKINVMGAQGDKKTVAVTVVKKRTYVKRSLVQEAEAEAPPEEVAVVPAAAVPEVVSTPISTEKPPEVKTVLSKEELEDEEQKKKKGKAVKTVEKQKKRKLDIRDLEIEEETGDSSDSLLDLLRKRPVLRKTHNQAKHVFQKPVGKLTQEVSLPEHITVADLAQKMSVKAAEVIKRLMKLGMMVTINQMLDRDTATLVVEELGHKAVAMEALTPEAEYERAAQYGPSSPRAPVVTIMGHVDHGKTTLLDYIRRTKVAAGEAGGITQSIGAYHVETDRGMITFLDTPGHEAFTGMRSRGAQLTDLVVLVVAADDGVMPQTIEAIQHAKAGGVPIIVAVNKIDKPEADPEKIKSELLQYEVVSEEWGGDTMFANISAKQGTGVDKLLETILLQAEMLELAAPVQGPARGVVIEARVEKGRGVVASILVQKGTLAVGDVVLAGCEYGRVRALINEQGRDVRSAGPSIPVELLGFSGAPNAGDELAAMPNEKAAREIADFRLNQQKEAALATQKKASLEDLFATAGTGVVSTLNIVLKTDVQGSLEALSDALLKLSTSEVKVNLIARGVGGITSSDAALAAASNAIIIGFNVRADHQAKQMIARDGVDLHYYSIIYDAINQVKQAMHGMLAPERKESIIGLAEVRGVFHSSKFGAIAGCMVIDGLIKRNRPIRVLRDNVVIYEGALESLRRVKEDISEARQGTECGIGVKDYNDVKVGDQIEVFEVSEVQRTL